MRALKKKKTPSNGQLVMPRINHQTLHCLLRAAGDANDQPTNLTLQRQNQIAAPFSFQIA
jgi:hypothetical protein